MEHFLLISITVFFPFFFHFQGHVCTSPRHRFFSIFIGVSGHRKCKKNGKAENVKKMEKPFSEATKFPCYLKGLSQRFFENPSRISPFLLETIIPVPVAFPHLSYNSWKREGETLESRRKAVPKVVPFLVTFWSSFWLQNGAQNGPKTGSKRCQNWFHFWIHFFEALGAL